MNDQRPWPFIGVILLSGVGTAIALQTWALARRVMAWLVDNPGWTLLGLLTFVALGILLDASTSYLVEPWPRLAMDPEYAESGRLYLLSAIAQGLAAILAVLATMLIVAVQLAAQNYWPNVTQIVLLQRYIWGYMAVFVVTIPWALFDLASPVVQLEQRGSTQLYLGDDTAFMLALLSAGYLPLFAAATLKRLTRGGLARWTLAGAPTSAYPSEAYDTVREGLETAVRQRTYSIIRDILREVESHVLLVDSPHYGIIFDGCIMVVRAAVASADDVGDAKLTDMVRDRIIQMGWRLDEPSRSALLVVLE